MNKVKSTLFIIFVMFLIVLINSTSAISISITLTQPEDEANVVTTFIENQYFRFFVDGAFDYYNCSFYINDELIETKQNIANYSNNEDNIEMFDVDTTTYHYFLDWKIQCNATQDFGEPFGIVTNVTNSSTYKLYENRNITNCTNISKSGVFNLTQSITDVTSSSCIQISSNDVMINMNGFNITGLEGNYFIFLADNVENVTIDGQGGIISSVELGVFFNDVVGFIDNVSFQENSQSIFLNASNISISNSNFINNNIAILLQNKSNLTNVDSKLDILDENNFENNLVDLKEYLSTSLIYILRDFEISNSSVYFESYTEDGQQEGDVTNITVIGEDWELSVGNSTIFIPQNTIIMRSDGLNMNIFDLNATNIDVENLQNIDAINAINFGIPDFGLNFTNNITITVSVDIIDDFELDIYKSENGIFWEQEGLTNITCKVIDSYCLFQTTKTSYFAMNASIPFCGGVGTAINPFLICIADELNASRNYLSAHYELNNDINLNISPYNEGDGWNPIGNNSDRFTGTFNGNNYVISNLFINRTNTDYVGMFGHLNSSSEIKNLKLINVNVTGSTVVGGLAGKNEGVISNLYLMGNIKGHNQVGGLIGRNDFENTLIENSYSITIVNGNNGVGGLVGVNVNNAKIKKSNSTVTLVGGQQIGGLVGSNQNSTIENSYSTGIVTGDSGVGGLVGTNLKEATLNNSISKVNITANDQIGGLVGSNQNSTIENSYSIGEVDGNNWVGGLVGTNSMNALIENSYSTGNIYGTAQIGGLVGYNAFNGTILDSYSTGNVYGSSDFIGGLAGVNGIENENDISLISNSYSTGNSNGTGRVGGLVGYVGYKSLILNSYSIGNTSGIFNVGGFVGINLGKVSNSYSMSIVTRTSGESNRIGGFAGRNFEGNITYSYSLGSVHFEGGDDPTNKGFVGEETTTGDKYDDNNNFWDIQTSSQNTTLGNATGKTTSQMKSLTTFSTWNMTSTEIDLNNGYPFLAWQDNKNNSIWLIYVEPEKKTLTPVTSVAAATIFHASNQRLEEGYNRHYGKGQVLRFNIAEKRHEMKINEIIENKVKITISSNPQTKILEEGEEWKVNIDNDQFYDILITLKKVSGQRALIEIKYIKELFSAIEEELEENDEFLEIIEEVQEEKLDNIEKIAKVEEVNKKSSHLILLFLLAIVMAISGVLLYIEYEQRKET